MSKRETPEKKVDNQEQEDLDLAFLERPAVNWAIKVVSEQLEEREESTKPEQPSRNKTLDAINAILIALMISGLGVLAFTYPHALDSFDPHYIRANNFPVLIFFVFIIVAVKLLWGQVGGALVVAICSAVIVKSILSLIPNQLKTSA